jgi:HSP20 family protein
VADYPVVLSDVPESPIIHPSLALEVADQNTARKWVSLRQNNLWTPPTDAFELEDCFVVVVEIAGMRDNEFNVTLDGRHLSISGTRARLMRDLLAFQQMEIRSGDFRTDVILPWLADRERVSATYRDGFLRVELPRARGQQIQIVNVEQESDAN